MKSKKYPYYFIFLLYILICTMLIASLPPMPTRYFYLIDSIRKTNEIPPIWEEYHPKFFFIFSATVLKLIPLSNTKLQLYLISILNIIAGLITLYIIYSFFNKFKLEEEIKLLSFLLIALNPVFIITSLEINNDSFVVLFSTATIYFLYLYLKKETKKDLVLMSLFLILANITKQISLALFIAIVGILTIKLIFDSKHKKKNSLIDFLIFIILFLLTVPFFGRYVEAYIITGIPSPFGTSQISKLLNSIEQKSLSSQEGYLTSNSIVIKTYNIISSFYIEFYATSVGSYKDFFEKEYIKKIAYLETNLNMFWFYLVVGLLPSLVFICGFFYNVYSLINKIIKKEKEYLKSYDWIFIAISLTYIPFFLILNYMTPWLFASPKYLLPALLAFLKIFVDGLNIFFKFANNKTIKKVLFYLLVLIVAISNIANTYEKSKIFSGLIYPCYTEIPSFLIDTFYRIQNKMTFYNLIVNSNFFTQKEKQIMKKSVCTMNNYNNTGVVYQKEQINNLCYNLSNKEECNFLIAFNEILLLKNESTNIKKINELIESCSNLTDSNFKIDCYSMLSYILAILNPIKYEKEIILLWRLEYKTIGYSNLLGSNLLDIEIINNLCNEYNNTLHYVCVERYSPFDTSIKERIDERITSCLKLPSFFRNSCFKILPNIIQVGTKREIESINNSIKRCNRLDEKFRGLCLERIWDKMYYLINNETKIEKEIELCNFISSQDRDFCLSYVMGIISKESYQNISKNIYYCDLFSNSFKDACFTQLVSNLVENPSLMISNKAQRCNLLVDEWKEKCLLYLNIIINKEDNVSRIIYHCNVLPMPYKDFCFKELIKNLQQNSSINKNIGQCNILPEDYKRLCLQS